MAFLLALPLPLFNAHCPWQYLWVVFQKQKPALCLTSICEPILSFSQPGQIFSIACVSSKISFVMSNYLSTFSRSPFPTVIFMSEWVMFGWLNWCNSILADDTNRAIPGNLEMQVRQSYLVRKSCFVRKSYLVRKIYLVLWEKFV